jgi:xanthine phosphoribosyltransferase
MMPPAPQPPRPHIALSWDEIQRDAGLLAETLRPLGPWRGIVAVTRGGLVPAALIARALDIRLVETVCIATYEGERAGAPDILKKPAAAGDGEGWLAVDDLADTGATARALGVVLPKAHLAVLYVKPQGKPLAGSFVTEFPQESWIDFPWEMAFPE